MTPDDFGLDEWLHPTPIVLDSSAVLAWLAREPGFDVVDPLLPDAIISAANWAEVLQKVTQAGRDASLVATDLLALGITVEPVEADDASVIAALWVEANDLSLGDRCCLALARRLRAKVVTADKRFEAVSGVKQLLVVR